MRTLAEIMLLYQIVPKRCTRPLGLPHRFATEAHGYADEEGENRCLESSFEVIERILIRDDLGSF